MNGFRIFVYLVVGLSAFLFLVRYYLISRSLWYDEMYTVSHFVGQPWSAIVAGTYSPNNHVLSSLLIKLCAQVGSFAGLWDPMSQLSVNGVTVPVLNDSNTLRFRLPAMVAGTLASLAVAWPLRPRSATDSLVAFIALLMLAGMQPWMLVFSTEARGYIVALLLTILATNVLSRLRGNGWLVYALLMAAAIYTIPLAGTIFVGHFLALALFRRHSLKFWTFGTMSALVVSALLYFPHISAMGQQSATMHSSTNYLEFLAAALRYSVTGWNTGGIGSVGLAVVLLAAGLPLAFREPRLRFACVTFAVASGIALLLPAFFPALRQSRFAFWLVPPIAMGYYGLIMGWGTWTFERTVFRVARTSIVLGAIVLLAWQAVILSRIPPSPTLDAMLYIDKKAAPDARILGVYLGALESYFLYQPFINGRGYLPILSMKSYQLAREAAGAEEWAYVISPQALREGSPALDRQLHADGDLMMDLPGRYDHVQVFRLHRLPAAIAAPEQTPLPTSSAPSEPRH